MAPRWPTRVFAAESVRRVIQVCDGNTVHFDLALAREMRNKTSQGEFTAHHHHTHVSMFASSSDCTGGAFLGSLPPPVSFILSSYTLLSLHFVTTQLRATSVTICTITALCRPTCLITCAHHIAFCLLHLATCIHTHICR